MLAIKENLYRRKRTMKITLLTVALFVGAGVASAVIDYLKLLK